MASLSTCNLGLWLGWPILLNLVNSEPTVAGRTGNGEYFVGTLFEVWTRAHLVPRNTSTKTWDEDTMIQRASAHGVGKTDKSTVQQVNMCSSTTNMLCRCI